MNFDPEKYIIFEGVTGSNLYGTATPESDLDTRGIVMTPLSVVFDLFNKFEQKDSFDGKDRVLYDIGKFFKLCVDSNPNIIELLFIPENKWIASTRAWENIIYNRKCFLSSKVKFTFLGYAFSQVKAIERHRKWFIDPPKNKPDLSDYGLNKEYIDFISENKVKLLQQVNYELLDEETVDLLPNWVQYYEDLNAYNNYLIWKKERNPKRAAYEIKYGYDTKYASHVVRLLLEGKELLLTGKINFPLEEKEYITYVKNGGISYDDFLNKYGSDSIEKDFDDIYKKTILPHQCDVKRINDIYYNLYMDRGY